MDSIDFEPAKKARGGHSKSDASHEIKKLKMTAFGSHRGHDT